MPSILTKALVIILLTQSIKLARWEYGKRGWLKWMWMWLIYIYINSWMTAHNSLFGFIHSYKLDETNLVFNNAAAKQSPYPVIIHDPTIRQAYRNWNTADTGCLIFTSLTLIAMAYPAAMGMKEFSILERRRRFISMSSLSIWVAFFCGLRNSYNRL